VSSKPELKSIRKLQEAIQAAEKVLRGTGRVLVRYSGTENICRVMVEGPKRSETQRLAHELAAIVKKEIGV
jgi:phosphoglucosamine mutase